MPPNPSGKKRPATRAGSGPDISGSTGHIVVGIGASAGGLEALAEFFAQLPDDTGMSFVVVTHQHPGHVSLLPEILGKNCKIPVLAAADGTRVKPNQVYVEPSGVEMAILRGRLRFFKPAGDASRHLPIDFFFRSLAQDQKERAVCIILSGTGTDGTLGLRAIKAEAGMAMVQEAESAKYAGMPSSAITTGLADFVLRPAAMPARLVAFAQGPYLSARPASPAESVMPLEPLQKILVLLRSRGGHDFSSYKIATIRRRIERRMNVQQIREPEDYVRHLQQHPAELDVLFKELLISVTSFFRDRPAWDALAAKVLPEMLGRLPDNYLFRVWVPGCATGEEAYSVAILLRECAGRLQRHINVQVFGTDLDLRAIVTARAGRYPEGIAADVPPEWLARHFSRHDHDYAINKDIRNLVIFAPQNVTSDPPFTKLDWICCRNLLIYLNTDLQRRLVQVFHYALKPGGLLFLGSSETIGERSDLFRVADRRWKIFLRQETAHRFEPIERSLPAAPATGSPTSLAPAPAPAAEKDQRISRLVEQMLLSRYCPVGVLVNGRGDILYIHGRAGLYLEPAAGGQPRLNILEMAREGLADELRSALREADASRREVVRDDLRVKSNGHHTRASLAVVRLEEPESLRGLLLVLLRPLAAPARRTGRKETLEPGRTSRLTRALREAKESLRATVDELGTANEELRSANEELQSTNEEMQSSNEELETSREELQSLNEELATANAEQSARVEELARARDDMQNLLNSTEVATLFLDNALRIRRYTETAARLIHLIPTDLGRPLLDQASNLQYEHLAGDCQEVLKTLKPRQAEVETKDGAWYLMRILPYRTLANAIDGIVITFVNITDVTLAEKAGREARAFFEDIFDTVREPLLVLDEHHHPVSANHAFYTLFGWRPRQVEGEALYEIGCGEWDKPEVRRLLEEVLPAKRAVAGVRFESDFPKIGRRTFLLNARRLVRRTGLPGLVLLALQEIAAK